MGANPFFVSLADRFLSLLERLNLNYFRIHLIWFTINPLIWSVIFYLCNGRFHVSYVDSLFLCVSAQTVTGLSPLNASTLTGFQQAILYYLMLIGNYTATSWVMVLIRKHYFVAKVLKERPPPTTLARIGTKIRSKTLAVFDIKPNPVVGTPESDALGEAHQLPLTKVSSAPQAGQSVTPTQAEPLSQAPSDGLDQEPRARKQRADPPPPLPITTTSSSYLALSGADGGPENILSASPTSISSRLSTSGTPRAAVQNFLGEPLQINDSPNAIETTPPHTSPNNEDNALKITPGHKPSPLARQLTLATTSGGGGGGVAIRAAPGPPRQGTGLFFSQSQTRALGRTGTTTQPIGVPLTQVRTAPNAPRPILQISSPTLAPGNEPKPPTYEAGFGGFPTPLTLAGRLAKRVDPSFVDRVKRKLTINQEKVYLPTTQNPSQKDPEAASSSQPPAHTTSFAQEHLQVPTRRSHRIRTRTEDGNQHAPTSPPTETLAPPHLHSTHAPGAVVPEHLRHPKPVNRRSSDSSTDVSSGDWVGDAIDDFQEGVKRTVDFVIKVGRNSAFNTDELSDEQLEQVGGVEYKALRILSYVVGLYFVGTQLVTFAILTGYLYAKPQYDSVFAAQPRNVPKAWFSAFQAISAYTGGGLTLVDQGMVPFRAAYVMVIFQGMLIIAGNMGFAIFLRLTIWVLSKMAPERHQEPLKFLLEHPRRCFLYLFPSHQTWFLVVVFVILTLIEWFGFIILDIGLDVIEAIPIGERVLAGLFQSIAVRASGFAIVPLGSIAPAVKFLYVVMMYISAYPIAMSIRSTNVYEQRSLGIYEELTPAEAAEEADPDVDETAAKLVKNKEGEVLFSKYLGMHVRRQLSYDLWWLAAAMFLICIVERTEIMNPDNEAWFNQFQILFELVSAYSTVGLSLGIPTENFSFCGAMRPLSKLILCAVMIRGRHRDLPQAVDRAILLPHEFAKHRMDEEGRHLLPNSPPLNQTIPNKEPDVTNEKKVA